MIEASNLYRTYLTKNKNEINALNNINLTIEKGNITCLLGPNGAGKTTFVKCLSTLLAPTSGTIVIDNKDLYRNIPYFRPKITYLLGGERGLYNRLSGRDNILYFLALKGMFGKKLNDLITEYSRILDINDAIDDAVETYSRGMKQKIHLINSIIADSDILLFDEPTNGMDPLSSKKVRELIKEKFRNSNKYILLTSHIMTEVEDLSDDIIIINKGKINYKGNIELFKKNLICKTSCNILLNNDDNVMSYLRTLSEVDSNIEYTIMKEYVKVTVFGDNNKEIIYKYINKLHESIVSTDFKTTTLEDVYVAYLESLEENDDVNSSLKISK